MMTELDATYWMIKNRTGALVDATKTYGNESDAIANLRSFKPAFWSNCGNSNAPAGLLFETANRLVGIESAQDELRGHFTRNGRDVEAKEWLDTILPLNRAAVMDLMRAYQRIGVVQSPADLEARTERYEQVTA